MPKPLRKTITVPIFDGEVTIDVDFNVIEIVEVVYDMRAEYVAALLARPVKILRHQLARVMVDWIGPRVLEHTRQEIREYVMTASPEVLNQFIGCIQAAVLYSLKEITEDEFDRLAAGKDLDDPEEHKKKPESNGSSLTATE